LIETGITAAAEDKDLREKTIDELRLKDLKAKNYLF
jgi:hypothetical protein